MIMPFEIHLLISRCWFQKFCSFTPGKMMQFDYVAFFRMGWFSHQPDMFFSIGIVNEIPPFLESESWFGLITFWRKTMHEDMIQEACLYKGQWCYGQQPHQHSAIFTNFWFYHWSSTGPSIYLQIMKRSCKIQGCFVSVRWKFDDHLVKECIYYLAPFFDIQGIWF